MRLPERGLLLQIDILCGLDDLRDEVPLDLLPGERAIIDHFVHPPNPLPQLGIIAILNLIIRPSSKEEYLLSLRAIATHLLPLWLWRANRVFYYYIDQWASLPSS